MQGGKARGSLVEIRKPSVKEREDGGRFLSVRRRRRKEKRDEHESPRINAQGEDSKPQIYLGSSGALQQGREQTKNKDKEDQRKGRETC